jgi:broad specificity phosphatase PhoE
MSLTLLRHAPLAKKYQKRYVGWEDIPLDEALFFTPTLPKKRFDAIYSSDLKRCIQTVTKLGFNYTKDYRLREVRFKKEIALKSFQEVEKLPSFKAEYLENSTLWHHYIAQESPEEFAQRIENFLQELPKGKEILICTHAGVIRHILTTQNSTKTSLDYLESITLPW